MQVGEHTSNSSSASIIGYEARDRALLWVFFSILTDILFISSFEQYLNKDTDLDIHTNY